MARVKVTHSDDAVQITFNGDKRNPEPSTAVIQFPGGHVEVSRCGDGTYWAHLSVVAPENVTESRVEHDHAGWLQVGMRIPDLPCAERVTKVALRISNAVPRLQID